MPRTKKWVESKVDNGFTHTHLSSWKYFSDYINQKMLKFPGYIFRGQRSEHWKLESTLDRLKKGKNNNENVHELDHLQKFKYAIRGRRGHNPSQLTNDDLWSLGQHHGLATPLLDFTSSPYVAAFFAFADNRDSVDGNATVWALHKYGTTNKAMEIHENSGIKDSTTPNIIKSFDPLVDENARLVNQSGCFIYLPENTDLEEWVKTNITGEGANIYLMKLTIPSKDREFALIALNRMNINYLTLFPDLYGASMHCNLSSEIPAYAGH